jgi:TRAP-type C4-dicarboxylate transport system substrate-binding protein
MRFAEVAPYIVEIKEYPQTWPITISDRVWRSLSASDQAVLVKAANDAGKVYARTTLERAQSDIDAMKAENKAEVIAIDRAAMRARLEPLYTRLVQEGVVPQSLVDAVAKLPK